MVQANEWYNSCQLVCEHLPIVAKNDQVLEVYDSLMPLCLK